MIFTIRNHEVINSIGHSITDSITNRLSIHLIQLLKESILDSSIDTESIRIVIIDRLMNLILSLSDQIIHFRQNRSLGSHLKENIRIVFIDEFTDHSSHHRRNIGFLKQLRSHSITINSINAFREQSMRDRFVETDPSLSDSLIIHPSSDKAFGFSKSSISFHLLLFQSLLFGFKLLVERVNCIFDNDFI